MIKYTFAAWDTVVRELQEKRDSFPRYSAQWIRYESLLMDLRNEWEETL